MAHKEFKKSESNDYEKHSNPAEDTQLHTEECGQALGKEGNWWSKFLAESSSQSLSWGTKPLFGRNASYCQGSTSHKCRVQEANELRESNTEGHCLYCRTPVKVHGAPVCWLRMHPEISSVRRTPILRTETSRKKIWGQDTTRGRSHPVKM